MAETTYATLEDFKARFDITSADDDAIIGQILEAASRQVDGWCGRVFPDAAGDGTTRRLTADSHCLLILPDDLHSITSVAVDRDGDGVFETPWEVTDVDTQPYPGPWQVLRPRNGKSFPTHRYAVQIVGEWGFGVNVPAPIREATLLQAARLFKRKDAPFGIAGTVDHGQLQTISRVDPDIQELIKPFIRHAMVV